MRLIAVIPIAATALAVGVLVGTTIAQEEQGGAARYAAILAVLP